MVLTTAILGCFLALASAYGGGASPATAAVVAATAELAPLERFFRHALLPELVKPSDDYMGAMATDTDTQTDTQTTEHNSNSGGVWQTAPRLWRDVEGCDSKSLFSFSDAVAAARGGLLDRASVAKSEEAKLGRWKSEIAPSSSADDLRTALDRGTIFFNGAGLYFPSLANLASICQVALGLPSNVNVYMTKPGRKVSVCPHTDAQDVLIFQTAGRKRWKVWAPPKPVRGKDPFGRGKRGDQIHASELGEPLLDAWLDPGSVLYVPIGFPHATSTDDGQQHGQGQGHGDGISDRDINAHDDGDISCHVTLNVDTYFYGLCFSNLRAIAAARAGSADRVDPLRLSDDLRTRMFSPLPLGFLNRSQHPSPGLLQHDDGDNENDNDDCDDDLCYGEAFQTQVEDAVRVLNEEAAAACGIEAPSLGDTDAVQQCVRFLVSHWRSVMTPTKYSNVGPPFPRMSIEALGARVARDAKNRKELALQQKLGAFASTRRR